MCSYNNRKAKSCNANPKHLFREIILCAAAMGRPNREKCPEDTWTDLRNVAKTGTSLVCSICNGVEYVMLD